MTGHSTERKWVAVVADDLPSGLAANTAAVPAPGGLVLALIALPVLGARRYLRRKAAESAA